MIFTSKRLIIISVSFVLLVMLIKFFVSQKRKNREIEVLKYKYNKCIHEKFKNDKFKNDKFKHDKCKCNKSKNNKY